MKRKKSPGLDRRTFLTAGGATVAGSLLVRPAGAWWFRRPEPPAHLSIRPPRRAKIALVFSHVPTGRPTWPTKDYDYQQRLLELTVRLKDACPDTEFEVSDVNNREEAKKVVERSPDVDGFLVYIIGIWTGAGNEIMKSGKPTVLVDDLFAGSGEILGPGPEIRKENYRAALIASSDFNDVVRGVRWLETIAALKGARLINVKDGDLSGQAERLKDVLGVTMLQMKADELQRRYGAADEKLGAKWADYWIDGAERVVEPTRDTLLKSGRIHVAFCKALEEMEADGVTMDCLGFFYRSKIDAYPCLSFFEILNQGLSGVCEADIDSASTFLMMRYLTGRPGYVSDPVIDTSRDEIIYAHCVATNRVFGPDGKANKYIIRSHAEDEKGAVVRSLLPLGEQTTTMKIHLGSKTLLVHSGVTTRNVEEEKACRTKLAARTDAEMLLRNWTRGWHRVTFYGDWRNDAINLGQLLGLNVIEEDKPMA
jgi:hypothetical protein